MFVGGWWDGFRLIQSMLLETSVMVVLFVVLIVFAAAMFTRSRRNKVEGHRVHWN